MLILISDGNVSSVGYQINCISFAKLFVVNRKRKLNNAFYVVFTRPKLASSIDSRWRGLQCPRQVSVEIFVNSLHILKGDLLSEHHLIECANKERIQESSMEDCQSDNSTNELEVVQMFGIDAGVRIDLKGVIIVCRVFKKTIERVEHFVREKEEVFTRIKLADDTQILI